MSDQNSTPPADDINVPGEENTGGSPPDANPPNSPPQLSAEEIAALVAQNKQYADDKTAAIKAQQDAEKASLLEQKKYEELYTSSEQDRIKLEKENADLKPIVEARRARLLDKLGAKDDKDMAALPVLVLENLAAKFAVAPQGPTPPGGAGGGVGPRGGAKAAVDELAARGDFKGAWKEAQHTGVPFS